MEQLWRIDRELFRLLHETYRRDWLDPIMRLITDTGLGHVQGVILLLLAIPKKVRPYALACFAAGATSGIIRLLIVEPVNRQRPSNFDFARPLEQVFGNSSFPSGHTTTSFAIAIMLAWMLKGRETAWIAWLVSFWAVMVAISRVYVGVHYPTDVLGAAFLGSAVGTATYLFWQKKGWVPDQDSSKIPIERNLS